jgi:ABC-type phosphate transport system auxiliary subunit
MRLIGFLAIGRVLRRHGVPLAMINDIARETLKSQGLAVPEAERLAAGRQFLSPENRALLSKQAVMSMTEGHRKYPSAQPVLIVRMHDAKVWPSYWRE